MSLTPPTPAPLPPTTTVYPARAVAVSDGDTVHLTLLLGLEVCATRRCRVAHVNAPESGTAAGKGARAFTQAWLAAVGPLPAPLPIDRWWPLVAAVEGVDPYGRPIVEVRRVVDGASLGADLLASGNAVPYPPPAGGSNARG